MCVECYISESRITPLLNPIYCLKNHTQYICGNCGRCICIEYDPKNNLQRWNFPFKSLEFAQMYLRVADYTTKKSCGIYEIQNQNRKSIYKIFPDQNDLEIYLKKHKDKACENKNPVFKSKKYIEYPKTQVKKLNPDEIQKYISERKIYE